MKKKYLIFLLIMISITILFGTSYALLRTTDIGTNTYVMNTGLLEVSFLDSKINALSISNMIPMSDSDGISQSDELEFVIKNTGSVDAMYDVYIEETSSNNFKKVIKYVVNKNDTGYGNFILLNDNNYIDKDELIEIDEEVNYKVKLWLASEAESEYMNKTFTAKVIVESKQTTTIPLLSKMKKVVLKNDNLIIEEDGITYISGSSDDIDFNYVWYSGKLWRITNINEDGTMKLITDDTITTISYNEKDNSVFFTDKNTNSYVYQWLNQDFLSTLYNYENIIETDASWYSLTTTNISTKINSTVDNVITYTTPVGLLNSYEYYMSYKNTSYSNGYLNIGYWWWTLNPYSESCLWGIGTSGYGNGFDDYSYISIGIRPSIILKSTILFAEGNGTKNNPYRLVGDKVDATFNTTLLNTRTSGEYVIFDEELYRIVSIEEGITKLNKYDYIRDTSDTVITKMFGSSTTFEETSNTQSDDYLDYYLNNTWYNSISLEYQNMMTDGTYYLGQVNGSGVSYKKAICSTVSSTISINDCEKTTSTWTGLVGLPRYGEMFASQQGSGYSSSSYMWLITPYSTSYVWNIHNNSIGDNDALSNLYSSRPSITLKSTVKITRGSGLKNDPFEISL